MTGLFSTAQAAERSTVLIMGDSLSAAYNIAIEASWPELFRTRLENLDSNLHLVNTSISGETTIGGVERLPDLLERHRPTYLILELGGNDGLRGYRFADTRANLEAMINMALERHIRVMLVGVRLPPNLGPVYNQRFQAIYQSLADSKPVTYLPRFLEGIAASDPELMQDDGIHPTQKAQGLLANRVFEYFLRLRQAPTAAN
jgi:acyl-CoA thioesterase-1